jgi:hypothetical protein
LFVCQKVAQIQKSCQKVAKQSMPTCPTTLWKKNKNQTPNIYSTAKANNGNQVKKAKSKQALYYDRGAKSFRMIPKKWTKTWAKAKVTLDVSPSRWSKVEAKPQTPM